MLFFDNENCSSAIGSNLPLPAAVSFFAPCLPFSCLWRRGASGVRRSKVALDDLVAVLALMQSYS